MARPTDISSKATAESRRKGAFAANAKRRELGLSLRQRIAHHMPTILTTPTSIQFNPLRCTG